MRKISIKFKTILWFVGFFTILTILNQIILWSSSSQIVIDTSEEEIIDIVNDITEHLVITENGPVYMDDDDIEPFIYYQEGIIVAFYQNNQLVYGTLPNPTLEGLTLQIGETQTKEINEVYYIVLDVYINQNTILRAVKNISNVDNSIRSLLIISLILSPVIIIVTGIGGYVILKQSFKPIDDIVSTTKNIKDQQLYHLRIPLSNNQDELYHMTQMINDMLASTEAILEREKQFTSNVSHELRTPLSVLKAQLEYLSEKIKETPYQDDMQDILKQSNYLEDMVKAILMLTKLNEQKSFQKDNINMRELTDDIIESVKEDFTEKNIEVNVNGDSRVSYQGDQMLLMSLLTNVISNAFKYNKKEGYIDIHIQQRNQGFKFEIKDSGIGMSEETIQHINEPFYRSDDVRTQQDLSLGVGMTIVSNIIALYQGKMHISSALNQGTTITIELP